MSTAKGFGALPADAQLRHRSYLESLGIDVEHAMSHRIDTSQVKKPVTLTLDLHRTHILPKVVVVNDVATMKKFGGVPDEHFTRGAVSDSGIEYPPEMDDRANRLIDRAESHAALTATVPPAHRDNVRKAMRAYMIGNSQKVKSYEPMINALHFPQYAA